MGHLANLNRLELESQGAASFASLAKGAVVDSNSPDFSLSGLLSRKNITRVLWPSAFRCAKVVRGNSRMASSGQSIARQFQIGKASLHSRGLCRRSRAQSRGRRSQAQSRGSEVVSLAPLAAASPWPPKLARRLCGGPWPQKPAPWRRRLIATPPNSEIAITLSKHTDIPFSNRDSDNPVRISGGPSGRSAWEPVPFWESEGPQHSPGIGPGRSRWSRAVALSRLFPSTNVTSKLTLATGQCNSNRYSVQTGFAVTPTKQTTVVLSNRNKKPPPGGVPNLQTAGPVPKWERRRLSGGRRSPDGNHRDAKGADDEQEGRAAGVGAEWFSLAIRAALYAIFFASGPADSARFAKLRPVGPANHAGGHRHRISFATASEQEGLFPLDRHNRGTGFRAGIRSPAVCPWPPKALPARGILW